MPRPKRTMIWDAKRNCWRKSKLVTLPDGSRRNLRKDFRYPHNQQGHDDAAEAWVLWLEAEYQRLGINKHHRHRKEAEAMAKWAIYTRTPENELLPTPPETLQKVTEAPDITDITDAHLFAMLKGIEDGKVGAEQVYHVLALNIRLREATAGAPFIRDNQEKEKCSFTDIATRYLDAKKKTLTPGGYNTTRSMVKAIQEWGKEVEVFNADYVQKFYSYLLNRVNIGTLGGTYASKLLKELRAILKFGFENELISALPKNLNSRMYSFTVETKEVKAPSIQEVKNILATQMSDSLRLCVLLGLNCGFTQQDILDLTSENIDLVAGTITRKRAKIKKYANAPTVCYPLWPETLELLKSVNRRWQTPKGITTQWNRLGCSYSFKFLRKAGPSALETHSEFYRFKQLFLAQIPTSVADRHYTKVDQEGFNQAVMWLRSQFLD